MKTIKIGIIGCGGMGNYHSKYLSQMEGVEIYACADISEDNLKTFKEKYKVPNVFSDYKKLLKLKELDAIFVCLPTYLHKEQVLIGAKEGKHIFCEKPIALKIKDAEKMVEVCQNNKVQFMIGFVRRFDNFWGKIREMVLNKEIGRPVLWRQMFGGGPPPFPWYMDAKKGAGPFIDGCVHNYDFCRYIFGEAEFAIGCDKKLAKNFSAIDTGTVVIQFKSGDQHILNWTWGLPKGTIASSAQDILGPEGSIIFEGYFDTKLLPEKFNPDKEGAFLICKGENRKVITYQKNDMFSEQVSHFIDCVRKNTTPKVTGIDGLKALEIGLSVLKSFQKKKIIKI